MKAKILSQIPTDEAPFLMKQVEDYRDPGLRGYSVVNNTPLTLSAIVKMYTGDRIRARVAAADAQGSQCERQGAAMGLTP